MPRFLRSGYFWSGFIAGAIVGPMILGKVSGTVKAAVPSNGG